MEQEALEKQKAASASTETDVEPCYFEHEDDTHPSFRTETDVDPYYTEPEDAREDKTRTGRRSSIRRSHQRQLRSHLRRTKQSHASPRDPRDLSPLDLSDRERLKLAIHYCLTSSMSSILRSARHALFSPRSASRSAAEASTKKSTSEKPALRNDVVPYRLVDLSSVHDIARRS